MQRGNRGHSCDQWPTRIYILWAKAQGKFAKKQSWRKPVTQSHGSSRLPPYPKVAGRLDCHKDIGYRSGTERSAAPVRLPRIDSGTTGVQMFSKKKALLIACGAAIVLQAFITTPALAHHVTIVANAYCNYSDYRFYIDYTSTSWCTADQPYCANPQIDISVNGVKVGEGAYASPDYSFSGGPILAPEGTSAVVQALAVGDWGDGYGGGQSASVTVDYVADPQCVPPVNGRFTGGGHQVKVDQVRVTRGLTIHCDLLLSNNLEVNWTGNKFHMTEHLETVACTDSPDIDQFPPAAPLDTLIGIGRGRYNGEDGYTIEFTLVDAGEPGSNDQMQILIYETANPGNVVLDVPLQVLTGGNLQAHYDQPHK